MVPRWPIFGNFLGPAFPESHVQHISDQHSKFALRPHHDVLKYGRHPICDRGKKEEKMKEERNNTKI